MNHPFELYHQCHSELSFQDALSEWLLMTTQQKARYHQEYEDQLKIILKKKTAGIGEIQVLFALVILVVLTTTKLK